MDLTQSFPCSPRKKMAGLVHLPRMVDKIRALKNNTLGEYIYPCPLDQIILDFLQVSAEELANRTGAENDEQISQWVESQKHSRNREEKEAVNNKILERRPDSEDGWKRFQDLRDKTDPSRTDVVTWVDLIDLEEGRL